MFRSIFVALVTATALTVTSAAFTAVDATARTAASVRIVSVTSPVSPGSHATLMARVSPARVQCSIMVRYMSGLSVARGLAAKRAVNGRVSWTWMVGTNTTAGRWPIYVECGSAIAKTSFRVS